MKALSTEEFDYIASMTKAVIEGSEPWSRETGHVTVRSCQNYMYDFGDEDLIAACLIDGLFTAEEMQTCIQIKRSADALRNKMEELQGNVFVISNAEKLDHVFRIVTKVAILYFVNYFRNELAAETSKAA